jgi:hypothetical protein
MDDLIAHPPPPDAARALQAAQWVTTSLAEWNWSDKDQEAMARYVLWASRRLAEIRALTNYDTDESPGGAA